MNNPAKPVPKSSNVAGSGTGERDWELITPPLIPPLMAPSRLTALLTQGAKSKKNARATLCGSPTASETGFFRAIHDGLDDSLESSINIDFNYA
jgi:hypothetical protein